MLPNDLIETGNYTGLIMLVIFALVTGGTGAAVVNAVAASRRGIKGDALQNDANAIEGFNHLAAALQQDNEALRKRLDKFEADTAEHIADLKREIVEHMEYNSILVRTLVENTIEVPPRPIKPKRKREAP